MELIAVKCSLTQRKTKLKAADNLFHWCDFVKSLTKQPFIMLLIWANCYTHYRQTEHDYEVRSKSIWQYQYKWDVLIQSGIIILLQIVLLKISIYLPSMIYCTRKRYRNWSVFVYCWHQRDFDEREKKKTVFFNEAVNPYYLPSWNENPK